MIDRMQIQIIKEIEQSVAIKKDVLADQKIVKKIQLLAETCLASLRAGGKVIFAGNGGSFADAQHLSAEFISRFMFDRAPLASITLGTNNSAFSAIGNDYGYEQVFARELVGIAKKGDVFIPISTSGNSLNILAAVRAAIERDISTVALTGKAGGNLKELCECICIPSDNTARVQECHILIGHILCGLIESEYFKNK
ncbi:SIS domain-containing protein [Polynucleobacter sp. MWH-UH25E]|uniref:D-sedoheptulose-7-phosphate isomerase n=1 Tax=Polynucleobacter sp. MWH-UH25E TaxID=1855616 RepID=UPI002042463E|nr:SIS domain-containing protein [Polynucleobacter sp. MWH-UH25E]